MARMMAKSNRWMLGLIVLIANGYGPNDWSNHYLWPSQTSLSGDAFQHINDLFRNECLLSGSNSSGSNSSGRIPNPDTAGCENLTGCHYSSQAIFSTASNITPVSNTPSHIAKETKTTLATRMRRNSNTQVFQIPCLDCVHNTDTDSILNHSYVDINGTAVADFERHSDPYWQYYADCDRWEIVFANNILLKNDIDLIDADPISETVVACPIDSNSIDRAIERATAQTQQFYQAVVRGLTAVFQPTIQHLRHQEHVFVESIVEKWPNVEASIANLSSTFDAWEWLQSEARLADSPTSSSVSIPFPRLAHLGRTFSNDLQWAHGTCNNLNTDLSPDVKLAMSNAEALIPVASPINIIQGTFTPQIAGNVVDPSQDAVAMSPKNNTLGEIATDEPALDSVSQNISFAGDSNESAIELARNLAEQLDWIATHIHRFARFLDGSKSVSIDETEKVANERQSNRFQ